jgi:hypothetical protein
MAQDAPDEGPDDPVAARGALRGKRAALGVVIAMALAFILATAFHVIPAVFGAFVAPLPAGGPGSCAQGLRDLAVALDRDTTAPPWADPRQAARSEDRELAANRCAHTPGGYEAWAAFERLRIAKEQLEGRDPAALAQLKRDLAAYFPSDLR